MRGLRIRLFDESTESKLSYIMDHIIYGTALGFSCYVWLPNFAIVTHFTNSLPLFVSCIVISCLIGILLTFRNRRTFTGSLANIVLGLGVYMAIIIGKYMPVFMHTLYIMTLAITIVGLLFIGCRRIKRIDYIKEIMYVRFIRSLLIIRRNFTIAALLVLIILPVGVHFWANEKMYEDFKDKYIQYISTGDTRGNESHNGELSVKEVYGDEYRLAQNIDTIKLIRDNETFQALDYDKKCEVVTAVIYCEARYLGLCELKVDFKELNDETLGFYRHSTKTITINSAMLMDGSKHGGSAIEVLNTCAHECRHCYQSLLSELYAKATPEERNLLAFTGEGVGSWVTNFADYKDETETEDGYHEYYTQALEQDARTYAKESVTMFYEEIDQLIAS